MKKTPTPTLYALSAGISLCLACAFPVTAAPMFRATILPSGAADMNNAGQVVGVRATGAVAHIFDEIFLWEDGVETIAASMPSAFPGYQSEERFHSIHISENGTLAGQIGGRIGIVNDTRAVIYTGGLANDLGALPGSTSFTGGRSGSVNGVNDSGVVVGGGTDSSGLTRPVIYSGGNVDRLYNSNGATTDINNAGQYIGGALELAGGFYSNGASIQPLSRLEGDGFSAAVALNSAGLIVGNSMPSTDFRDPRHLVVWDRGGPVTAVPGFESVHNAQPNDINSSGEIVGRLRVSDVTTERFLPFYSSTAGGYSLISDLLDTSDPVTSSVEVTAVKVINDSGWILATGKVSGTSASFILKPVPSVPPGPPPVPVSSIEFVKGEGSSSFSMAVTGKVGFTYQLRKSTGTLAEFSDVGDSQSGNGEPLMMSDPAADQDSAYYIITETPAE